MWMKVILNSKKAAFQKILDELNGPVTADNIYEAMIAGPGGVTGLHRLQRNSFSVAVVCGSAISAWAIATFSGDLGENDPLALFVLIVLPFTAVLAVAVKMRASKIQVALSGMVARAEAAFVSDRAMRSAFEERAEAEEALAAHETAMHEMSARRLAASDMATAARNAVEASARVTHHDVHSARRHLRNAAENVAWAEQRGDKRAIMAARGELAVAESDARAVGI